MVGRATSREEPAGPGIHPEVAEGGAGPHAQRPAGRRHRLEPGILVPGRKPFPPLSSKSRGVGLKRFS